MRLHYERDEGWTLGDVPGENHGLDARSTRYNEDVTLADIRYIEVKTWAEECRYRPKSGRLREEPIRKMPG